jgi:hypothetical protein
MAASFEELTVLARQVSATADAFNAAIRAAAQAGLVIYAEMAEHRSLCGERHCSISNVEVFHRMNPPRVVPQRVGFAPTQVGEKDHNGPPSSL